MLGIQGRDIQHGGGVGRHGRFQEECTIEGVFLKKSFEENQCAMWQSQREYIPGREKIQWGWRRGGEDTGHDEGTASVKEPKEWVRRKWGWGRRVTWVWSHRAYRLYSTLTFTLGAMKTTSLEDFEQRNDLMWLTFNRSLGLLCCNWLQ